MVLKSSHNGCEKWIWKYFGEIQMINKFRLNRQIIFKTKFYLNQLVWLKSYVALFYKNNHWVVNYWCLRNVVITKLNVIVPNQLWWHGTIMKQENIDWRFKKKTENKKSNPRRFIQLIRFFFEYFWSLLDVWVMVFFVVFGWYQTVDWNGMKQTNLLGL